MIHRVTFLLASLCVLGALVAVRSLLGCERESGSSERSAPLGGIPPTGVGQMRPGALGGGARTESARVVLTPEGPNDPHAPIVALADQALASSDDSRLLEYIDLYREAKAEVAALAAAVAERAASARHARVLAMRLLLALEPEDLSRVSIDALVSQLESSDLELGRQVVLALESRAKPESALEGAIRHHIAALVADISREDARAERLGDCGLVDVMRAGECLVRMGAPMGLDVRVSVLRALRSADEIDADFAIGSSLLTGLDDGELTDALGRWLGDARRVTVRAGTTRTPIKRAHRVLMSAACLSPGVRSALWERLRSGSRIDPEFELPGRLCLQDAPSLSVAEIKDLESVGSMSARWVALVRVASDWPHGGSETLLLLNWGLLNEDFRTTLRSSVGLLSVGLVALSIEELGAHQVRELLNPWWDNLKEEVKALFEP